MVPWLMAVVTHPVALLSLGGAAGVNARYWLAWWVRGQPWSASFPWATLLINVSGSLVLGVVAVLCLERTAPARQELFLLLGTGFCGGYTTFSTFELETWNLLRAGRWGLALLYVLGSVLAGFAAVALAIKATERMLPP